MPSFCGNKFRMRRQSTTLLGLMTSEALMISPQMYWKGDWLPQELYRRVLQLQWGRYRKLRKNHQAYVLQWLEQTQMKIQILIKIPFGAVAGWAVFKRKCTSINCWVMINWAKVRFKTVCTVSITNHRQNCRRKIIRKSATKVKIKSLYRGPKYMWFFLQILTFCTVLNYIYFKNWQFS